MSHVTSRVNAKKGKGGWWRVARRSHLQAGPCRGARSPSMVRNGRLCFNFNLELETPTGNVKPNAPVTPFGRDPLLRAAVAPGIQSAHSASVTARCPPPCRPCRR